MAWRRALSLAVAVAVLVPALVVSAARPAAADEPSRTVSLALTPKINVGGGQTAVVGSTFDWPLGKNLDMRIDLDSVVASDIAATGTVTTTIPGYTETRPRWVAETTTTEQVLVTPAWDEQVLVSAAWDEQVLVTPAWDEQVLVTPARTEQVLVTPAWTDPNGVVTEGYWGEASTAVLLVDPYYFTTAQRTRTVTTYEQQYVFSGYSEAYSEYHSSGYWAGYSEYHSSGYWAGYSEYHSSGYWAGYSEYHSSGYWSYYSYWQPAWCWYYDWYYGYGWWYDCGYWASGYTWIDTSYYDYHSYWVDTSYYDYHSYWVDTSYYDTHYYWVDTSYYDTHTRWVDTSSWQSVPVTTTETYTETVKVNTGAVECNVDARAGYDCGSVGTYDLLATVKAYCPFAIWVPPVYGPVTYPAVYSTVTYPAVYTTVTHPAVYQTVTHAAVYTTVTHPAVYQTNAVTVPGYWTTEEVWVPESTTTAVQTIAGGNATIDAAQMLTVNGAYDIAPPAGATITLGSLEQFRLTEGLAGANTVLFRVTVNVTWTFDGYSERRVVDLPVRVNNLTAGLRG